MKIEKVLIEKTLKAGDTVWEKGTVVDAPIPKEILNECSYGTGTVKILKQVRENVIKPTPAPVQKEKLEKATTATTVVAKEEKTEEKAKPKAKLKVKPKLKPKKKLVKRNKK